MECKLCQNNKDLVNSHIIPAFVFKWIKKTSATGYLRMIENFNKRVQDGKSLKLLCLDCERIFSKLELQFANNIFHPYVREELDTNCVQTGNIKQFEYGDWLLRFIISIHWRIIAAKIDISVPEYHKIALKKYENCWREFLLGKRTDTGKCETHVIFLQNLSAVNGQLPDIMSDDINYYILRSADGTIVHSKKKLGVFSKMGPIAFYTFIRNKKLRDAYSTKIGLHGNILTAQKLKNPEIVDFLFITRPNQASKHQVLSNTQEKVIEKSIMKDIGRSINSLTAVAHESDDYIKRVKKKI